jgi:hypothetical protein
MVEIAYWMNGLGEELSSRVRARFESDDGTPHIVVYEGHRRREFIVLAVSDCIVVRKEFVA